VARQMTLASDLGRIGVKTATSTVAGLNLQSAIYAYAAKKNKTSQEKRIFCAADVFGRIQKALPDIPKF
jgi:hypothetical protein